MTFLKGWKTRIVNFFALVIPVLSMTEVVNIIPDGYTNTYLVVLAIVNLILREITTTAPGKAD